VVFPGNIATFLKISRVFWVAFLFWSIFNHPIATAAVKVPVTICKEVHPVMAKATATAAKKAPSKSETLNNISAATGVSRKDVSAVLETLAGEVRKALGNRGPGVFAVPGLVKITKKKVPARSAKKNVPNPFKPGETMDVKARPAYNKVAIRALKNLKDMV
jgi:hypothetical protein